MMHSKRLLMTLCLTAIAAVLSGCRQDMHNQPKYIPLRPSEFFSNGSSARMPVPGTVARGHLDADTYFYTGKINGVDGTLLPFTATKAVLDRGEERYNIYCTPCHSRVGEGNGMIVQRGYRRAASLHEARLLQAPIGHFYDVISNGWGAMPDYSAQIDPPDRWAIAAYIRALQLSQNASVNDVPADLRGSIKTRQQLEAEFGGGVLGQRERSPMTTTGSTSAGTGQNTHIGPMTPTMGGTQSNTINRDVNEQGGGQMIQSARPHPQGQTGHAQGGDYSGTVAPRSDKGVSRGQTSLPQGNWQSGPAQRSPQEGQVKPQGDSKEPK